MKKISRSAFAKCQGLWDKYGWSSLVADEVVNTFVLGMKEPTETQWNSVFIAVERDG
jgi:hypothetical protein